MSNFLFCHNSNKSPALNQIKEIINLPQTFEVETFQEEGNIYGTSFHNNAPLKGKRIFYDKHWIILFAGDMVDYESVPYHLFIKYIENETFENFKDFNGVYSIFLFNKEENKLFLISDRRSQHPVYYFIENKNIIFSTDLSLFVKLLDKPEFNKDWLYDYLFFDYIIGQTTFLKDVHKMPAASYLTYSFDTCCYNVKEYSDFFRPKEKLLEGTPAFEYATEIFRERIPKYFEGSNNIACALTGGWDARTNIALAPNPDNITAFTYGIPGCNDLVAAKDVTDKINIKFKEIHFNKEFIENLPELMLETIYQSSGLQGILRASLLYVYKNLSMGPSNFDLVISGMDYDTLFRGHFGIPSVMFPDMAKIMLTGKININFDYWKEIFNSKILSEFSESVQNKLNYLQNRFGEFNLSANQILYILYYGSTQYFGGELKIANNFTTLRVPAWDTKIIELAYSIKEGSLSYSELAGHKRGKRDEMEIQSYLFLKLAPDLYQIPIRDTKPGLVLAGEIPFQAYKIYSRIKRRLKNTIKNNKRVALEDWNYWLNTVHPSFIDELIFSNGSEIKEFINNKFLDTLKSERGVYILGKLATAEIILRLIKNKWERFW